MIYLEIHFLIDGVGEWWWAEGPAASVPPASPPLQLLLSQSISVNLLALMPSGSYSEMKVQVGMMLQ